MLVKTKNSFVGLLQQSLLWANGFMLLGMLTVSVALSSCTEEVTNGNKGAMGDKLLRPITFRLGVDNATDALVRSTTTNMSLPAYKNQINIGIGAQQLEDVMPQNFTDATNTITPYLYPAIPTRGTVIKDKLEANAQLRACCL